MVSEVQAYRFFEVVLQDKGACCKDLADTVGSLSAVSGFCKKFIVFEHAAATQTVLRTIGMFLQQS